MASLASCIDVSPKKTSQQHAECDDDVSTDAASACDAFSPQAAPSTPAEAPSPTDAPCGLDISASKPTFAQAMRMARGHGLPEAALPAVPHRFPLPQPSSELEPRQIASVPFATKKRSARFPDGEDSAPEDQLHVKVQEALSSESATLSRVPFAQKLCIVQGLAAGEASDLPSMTMRFEQPEGPAACGVTGSGSRLPHVCQLGVQAKAVAKEQQQVVKVSFAQKRAYLFQDWECSMPDKSCRKEAQTQKDPEAHVMAMRAPFAQKFEATGSQGELSAPRRQPLARSSGASVAVPIASCSTHSSYPAACKGLSDLELSPFLF